MSEQRNAKADLAKVGNIKCLGAFSNFATIALPHWIERAIAAERDRDIYRNMVKDLQGDRLEALERENAALKERIERQGKRILIMQIADKKGPEREKILDRFEHLEIISAHMPECPADVLPPEIFGCDDILGCTSRDHIKACWRRVLGVEAP